MFNFGHILMNRCFFSDLCINLILEQTCTLKWSQAVPRLEISIVSSNQCIILNLWFFFLKYPSSPFFWYLLSHLYSTNLEVCHESPRLIWLPYSYQIAYKRQVLIIVTILPRNIYQLLIIFSFGWYWIASFIRKPVVSVALSWVLRVFPVSYPTWRGHGNLQIGSHMVRSRGGPRAH